MRLSDSGYRAYRGWKIGNSYPLFLIGKIKGITHYLRVPSTDPKDMDIKIARLCRILQVNEDDWFSRNTDAAIISPRYASLGKIYHKGWSGFLRKKAAKYAMNVWIFTCPFFNYTVYIAEHKFSYEELERRMMAKLKKVGAKSLPSDERGIERIYKTYLKKTGAAYGRKSELPVSIPQPKQQVGPPATKTGIPRGWLVC